MKLNQTEVRTVAYLVGGFIVSARRHNWRVPLSVAALADRINNTEPVSSRGHGTGCAATHHQESEHVEYIGSRIAAQQLGWSMKKVARNAERLGGRLIGSRWVFPADAIRTAQEQEEHDDD